MRRPGMVYGGSLQSMRTRWRPRYRITAGMWPDRWRAWAGSIRWWKRGIYDGEIARADGLFNPARLALMQGEHREQFSPSPGKLYALTLDVGGADFEVRADGCPPLRDREHDSTVALVFEVDPSTQTDSLIRAPTYRLVSGRVWQGTAHAQLYGKLRR